MGDRHPRVLLTGRGPFPGSSGPSPRRAAQLAVVAVLVTATLAGCSPAERSRTPATRAESPRLAQSGTATATPSSTTSSTLSSGDARSELQAYLDDWRTRGAALASQTYLTTDQQVINDADAPHLTSGTVTKIGAAQPTPSGLRYQVTLDLSFEGDPIAWAQGRNERFVYFTPRGGDIPYAMSFATGP